MIKDDDTEPFDWCLNLEPEDTGLPFVLFVSERHYVEDRGRPYLRVYEEGQPLERFTVVSIDDPIEIVAGPEIAEAPWGALCIHIVDNRALLMALWNEEIDQTDYLKLMATVHGGLPALYLWIKKLKKLPPLKE